MEDKKGRYIEIEEAIGYGQPVPSRTYSELLPDTHINENPVELQEVPILPQVKDIEKHTAIVRKHRFLLTVIPLPGQNCINTIILNCCS